MMQQMECFSSLPLGAIPQRTSFFLEGNKRRQFLSNPKLFNTRIILKEEEFLLICGENILFVKTNGTNFGISVNTHA
jgi:hypothetical protein